MKKRLLLILAVGIAFAPALAFADSVIGPYNSPDRADQTQMGSVFCDANITRLADKGQSSAQVNTNGNGQGSGSVDAGTVD